MDELMNVCGVRARVEEEKLCWVCEYYVETVCVGSSFVRRRETFVIG